MLPSTLPHVSDAHKEKIMTAVLEISCVNKTDRYNPHERIRSVGGKLNDGRRWRYSQEQAIKFIKDKTCRFFVRQAGKEVAVIVAESRYGHLYLKTVADGEQPNNLLSLNECPI